MSSIHCNVCAASGNRHIAHTHTTRGERNQTMEHIIQCGGWSLVKYLGGATNCPVLQGNVCTNPFCFNGMDGLVRFPSYGHTPKYCPCAWSAPQPPLGPPPLPPMGQLAPPPMQNSPPVDELCIEDIEHIHDADDDAVYGPEDEFDQLMDDWIETQELEEQAALHERIHYIEDESPHYAEIEV